MQYLAIVIAVGFILPTAFTQPHGHGHHGHHNSHVSGAPSASPTSGAPYGLNNGTAVASATGSGATSNTQYQTLTLQSTLYQTLPASNSQAPSESAVEGGASNTGSCSPASTVTFNPTTTVYITEGAAPAESGVESSAPVQSSTAAPVESGMESSTLVEATSAAPAAPASTKPASVAPIEPSAAPAPETSSAQVPSQAASSAPAVSSVAPDQPSSAAPINPTTSSPATSPSVAPSGGDVSGDLSADYCTYDGDKNNPPTWSGANYTGGKAGTKRGIVFVAGGDPEQTGLYKYANANNQILWLGNFYSAPPDPKANVFDTTKTEFVPQMYGLQSTKEWPGNADGAVKNHTKYFLSFGEPGTPSERFQTPDHAAQFYMDQMQKYTKEGVTIGAPGCLQNTQDWQWDQEFLCKCKGLGCSIGFLAAHWLDAAAPTQQQVGRAKGTIETYINVAKGKPVWIENIQAQGTAEEQKAFMDELVPWLEQQPAVQRYGWLPEDAKTGNGFVNLDGSVTELGQHYANLRAG